MRRRDLRRLALSAVAGCAACLSPASPLEVPDAALVFLVQTPGPIGQLAPLRGGASAPPPAVTLDRDERTWWLTLDEEALLEASPFVDLDALDESRLSSEAPDAACPRGRRTGTRLAGPVPEAAETVPLDTPGITAPRPKAIGEARLELSLDSGRCQRAGPDHLEPLAGAVPSLSTDGPLGGEIIDGPPAGWIDLTDVVGLADGRVLARTAFALYLLSPGAPYRDGPGSVLGRSGEPGFRELTGFAFDPASRRLALTVTLEREGDDFGAVLEAELDDARGLQWVGTATVVDRPLYVCDFAADGALIAAGRDGMLLHREPGATTFSRWRLGTERLSSLTPTEDTELPLAVTNRQGEIYLGDPRTGRFEVERPELNSAGQRVETIAAHQRPEGVELWVTTSSGRVLRRSPGGRWRTVQVTLPNDALDCVPRPDPCGHVPLVAQPTRMVLATAPEPTLHIGIEDCDALISYRLRDGCAAWTRWTVERRGAPGGNAVHVAGDRVTVGSNGGWVLVGRLE